MVESTKEVLHSVRHCAFHRHDWGRLIAAYCWRKGTTVEISVTVMVPTVKEVNRTLLVYYCDELGLTGTNVGCDTSSCGACTVHVNGESVKSRTMLAVQADRQEVTTIEGLASADELHPMQQSLQDNHGLQCGYCTPGMVMAACSLLDENPSPVKPGCEKALKEISAGALAINIVKAASACSGQRELKGQQMIPAAFDYKKADSAEEAIALIAEHGDEAKLLAGGHSLIP